MSVFLWVSSEVSLEISPVGLSGVSSQISPRCIPISFRELHTKNSVGYSKMYSERICSEIPARTPGLTAGESIKGTTRNPVKFSVEVPGRTLEVIPGMQKKKKKLEFITA